MTVLPDDLVAFASQPNPAVMSTVAADGRPVSVPVWYLLEDAEHILLSILAGSSRGNRLNHLRSDPRMSIAILGNDDWLKAVSIRGTAVEFFEDEDLTIIDSMAVHYLGSTYTQRNPRIAVRVRIDDWTTEMAQSKTYAEDPQAKDSRVG